MRHRACEPDRRPPRPEQPHTDDAKKDPNADGADKADWPMAGILAKPPRAGVENEILGLCQGAIPRGQFPNGSLRFRPRGNSGSRPLRPLRPR
jgi:hypothetical protein